VSNLGTVFKTHCHFIARCTLIRQVAAPMLSHAVSFADIVVTVRST